MNRLFTKWLFALIVLVPLVGCSVLPQITNNGAITASGTIQVDSVRMASELSGKVQEVKVQQGDPVKAGDVLFQLDDASLQTQRKQVEASFQAAQAAQAAAQANLDLIKAGATEDQLLAAQSQLDQANASLQSSQATLWSAEGSTRPEDIAAAQARLDLARQAYYHLSASLTNSQIDDTAAALNQAQSGLSQIQTLHDRLAADKRTPPDALEAASVALTDSQTIIDYAKQANQLAQDDSQPLYAQIAAVRKTWEVAQLNLSQAQARLAALRAESGMPQESVDAAQSAVDQCQNLVDKAKKAYDSLNTGSQADRLKTAWDEMQSAQSDFNAMGKNTGATSLEALISQFDAVTAQRNAAQANYNNVKKGARPEQVAAAQAQLDAAKAKVVEAQAAVDNIEVQMKKMAVLAPFDGIIINRSVDAGEVAPAGTTVVEMGNLDQVTLKVYVPEDQYGKIKLGQAVSIQVDSFPGRTFKGTVTSIANQAEFTPRNVQTQETRSTTVYAIEIHLPNADHALKPGMPADATF